MKNLSVMIKPASSLCNMRCKYCFYADISSIREQPSYGVMTSETRKKVLSNIFSQLDSGDSITFAFQGGEPTMAGIGWFRQFIQEARQLAGDGIQISYAFQTNGLLLDDDWLNLFKEHHFLVGLSLDGPKDFHDRNRPDAHGNGTFAHLLDIKKKMDRLHVSYNILTVLTNAAARHPQKLWYFLNEQQIAWVQFVPCLAPLDGEQNVYALTPERFASFYTALFDLWYPTLAQGRPMSIKLFDDLLALLAFGQETACGITGHCHPQIVVEANGNVYPCDFYAVDEWLSGNLQEDNIRTLYNSSAHASFRSRPRTMPEQCGDCPYASICGGGCPRMRSSVFCSSRDGFCGHRAFLDAAMPRLSRLAAEIRRRSV